MEKTIKAKIYFDGKFYCAKCLELDVFTQGKTVDETIENLKEAVNLHLEGNNPAQFGLSKEPGLFIMMESTLTLSHA